MIAINCYCKCPRKKVTHESCALFVHNLTWFLQKCSLPVSLSQSPSHCFLGFFSAAIWGTFFPWKLQHDHSFLWSSCGHFCLVHFVLKNTRAGIARTPRIPLPTPSSLQRCSWVVQTATRNKLITLQWLFSNSPPTSKPICLKKPNITKQNKHTHTHTPGPLIRKKLFMPGLN